MDGGGVHVPQLACDVRQAGPGAIRCMHPILCAPPPSFLFPRLLLRAAPCRGVPWRGVTCSESGAEEAPTTFVAVKTLKDSRANLSAQAVTKVVGRSCSPVW